MRSSIMRHVPALAGLLVLAGLGCGQQTELPPEPVASLEMEWAEGVPAGRWNVLLLTLDTTRGDALGCYGKEDAGTATLDSLAAAGVLFERMTTPVPMTCPAHATILTGLDPHEHGVRDNGRYVAGDSLLLLSEAFRERGYETAAFISAFPLDHGFGLSQGFDVYDDTFTERAVARSEQTSQRPADAVTDAALRWLNNDRNRSFFLWVHYFDPHAPYEAPAPFAGRHDSAYQDEIAFMDSEVGRLLREMRAGGLFDSTFVVVVGDHGESLGEHGEDSHSFFIYDATQTVPCLLLPPGLYTGGPSLRGRRVPWQARLRDLPLTVANLLGWEPGPWRDTGSTSLLPALDGATAPRPVAYMETLVPKLEYGWSDLRGVSSRSWKYIEAPRPELYDLRTDPAETVNVVDSRPEARDRLKAWLDAYTESEVVASQEPLTLDPEVVERLRSLGYLGGTTVEGEGSGADPKDRIDVYKKVMDARSYAMEYRAAEAADLLESVVRQEPDNKELLRLLASTYAMGRQLEDATAAYDRLLGMDATEPRFLKEAAQVAMLSEDHERAAELLDVLEGAAPAMGGNALLRGELLEAQELRDGALEAYRKELELFPASFEAYYRIGRIQRQRGDHEAAARNFERALEYFPGHGASLAALATYAFDAGETARGDSLLAAALEADPFDPEANLRRGLRARERNNLPEAREAYERAVLASPEYAEALFNLGNVYRDLGLLQYALGAYERAVELGFETAKLRTNQGVAFAEIGRLQDAVHSWERALMLEPDPETAAGLRRNIGVARQQLGP